MILFTNIYKRETTIYNSQINLANINHNYHSTPILFNSDLKYFNIANYSHESNQNKSKIIFNIVASCNTTPNWLILGKISAKYSYNACRWKNPLI